MLYEDKLRLHCNLHWKPLTLCSRLFFSLKRLYNSVQFGPHFFCLNRPEHDRCCYHGYSFTVNPDFWDIQCRRPWECIVLHTRIRNTKCIYIHSISLVTHIFIEHWNIIKLHDQTILVYNVAYVHSYYWQQLLLKNKIHPAILAIMCDKCLFG